MRSFYGGHDVQMVIALDYESSTPGLNPCQDMFAGKIEVILSVPLPHPGV